MEEFTRHPKKVRFDTIPIILTETKSKGMKTRRFVFPQTKNRLQISSSLKGLSNHQALLMGHQSKSSTKGLTGVSSTKNKVEPRDLEAMTSISLITLPLSISNYFIKLFLFYASRKQPLTRNSSKSSLNFCFLVYRTSKGYL